MKILSVVGARPQFIKAAPLSNKLRRSHQEVLLHTGQHYDYLLSRVFFEELGLAEPDYNLGAGSGAHGRQTARMLMGIEKALLQEKPGLVLVYGDTNSTLAGALAAAKQQIPLTELDPVHYLAGALILAAAFWIIWRNRTPYPGLRPWGRSEGT